MDHHPTIELDLSSLSNGECFHRISTAIDQLGGDEALVIRSDREPSPLLHALQTERRDLFDWYVLESGPQVHRVEIWRRPEPTRRTVGEFMDKDHRRLQTLVSELESHVSQRRFDDAQDRLLHLRVGLVRHIGMEERVLYPEYQRIHGAGAGLVHSLESEHSILLRLLGEIESALIAGNDEGARVALGDLRGILVPHGRNETAWIYPVIDISTARDPAGLVQTMQKL
jgi:uncharacterized protein (DUF2249 family)